MHENRWVDRFAYAWRDSLFFESLNKNYHPADVHLLSWLDPTELANIQRFDLWWMFPGDNDFPDRGWKIHISASKASLHDVVQTAVKYLIDHRIAFKVVLDETIFEFINSKAQSRGASGKVITVYPRNTESFRQIIEDLRLLLHAHDGPYILSDLRYKDSGVLGFRYGQLRNTHVLDVMGVSVPIFKTPDGEVVDDRNPYFSIPDGVSWPFEDWADPRPAKGMPNELLHGRYRITEALSFSNTGGVYLADDTRRERKVVLKEARPHTNPRIHGDSDATALLEREWHFLQLLAGTGRTPVPVERFRAWEHEFLVEEFISGDDIRQVFFDNNPLLDPGSNGDLSSEASRRYLEMFKQIFLSFGSLIAEVHAQGVILGDLTANNLLVNPHTLDVHFVDLEACRSATSEDSTGQDVRIYTPGFSHARRRFSDSTYADDLFSLATVMAYFIFPVAVMSYLREDVMTAYQWHFRRLGWPSEIYDMMVGLLEGSWSLGAAMELMQRIDVEDVAPTPYLYDHESASGTDALLTGLCTFIHAAADPSRESLYPMDPFMDLTNPLSLGFGAAGVVYALAQTKQPVPEDHLAWFQDAMVRLDTDDYPLGLLTGLAGLSWVAETLGDRDRAVELQEISNRRARDEDDYTLYYGLAGVGMANAHMFCRTQEARWLEGVRYAAERLCALGIHDELGTHWMNEFAVRGPSTGLGFGQAGVAMFLLRASELLGDARLRALGDSALDWELRNAEEVAGELQFRDETGTIEPYLEVGSAGVAQVLMRYGRLDEARKVLRSIEGFAGVLPGYNFGCAGLIETMVDASIYLDDPTWMAQSRSLVRYVKDVFMFSPPERFGLTSSDHATGLLAIPGDGLLRTSCDLATGAAGLVYALQRQSDPAQGCDFLLDGIGAPVGVGQREGAR